MQRSSILRRAQATDSLHDAPPGFFDLCFAKQVAETEAYRRLNQVRRNTHRLQHGRGQQGAARTRGAGGTGHAGKVEIHKQGISAATWKRNVESVRQSALRYVRRPVEYQGLSGRAQSLEEETA